MAHLWATTLPTPPAPMRWTLFMGMVGEGVGESGRAGKEFPSGPECERRACLKLRTSGKVRGGDLNRENAQKGAKSGTAERLFDPFHFNFRVHSRSFAVKNPADRDDEGRNFPTTFDSHGFFSGVRLLSQP
jgi:hypothetical protein